MLVPRDFALDPSDDGLTAPTLNLFDMSGVSIGARGGGRPAGLGGRFRGDRHLSLIHVFRSCYWHIVCISDGARLGPWLWRCRGRILAGR